MNGKLKRNNEQNFFTLYRKCFEGPRSETLEMSPKQANKKRPHNTISQIKISSSIEE